MSEMYFVGLCTYKMYLTTIKPKEIFSLVLLKITVRFFCSPAAITSARQSDSEEEGRET